MPRDSRGSTRASDAARPTVLVIGPVPPPAFGVAKATQLMLDSATLAERLQIEHMDISDRRGVSNIGRFDWWNVWLAFRHMARLALMLSRARPRVTMLTASQGKLGLLRDGAFGALAVGFRSRLVVYLRGSGYAEIPATQGRLAGKILRSLFRHSASVIVLGQSLVPMAVSVYPSARVVVVPNGCPPAVPPESCGARDESHPIVSYIGRLGRAKGIDEALLAARKLAPRFPGIEFILGGGWDSPEYEQHVRAFIEREGLSEVVHLPGPVSLQPKSDLLARSWVHIVPSHTEGQPWVILEAMSAGVPVVATDTGAIAETVHDGVTGFVVPVGDADALADRIAEVLRDHDLWKQMSDQTLARYEAHFTMERSHTLLADELSRVAAGDE